MFAKHLLCLRKDTDIKGRDTVPGFRKCVRYFLRTAPDGMRPWYLGARVVR
jgi:hypothetical protein